MDPNCVDASLALVDLHLHAKQLDKCAEVLQASLARHNLDFLHSKLADVLTLQGRHSDALASYHTALSLDPESADAKAGLDRLEKLMRGVDPDAATGDEDEDHTDATNDESDPNNGPGSFEGSQYM
mmetsp:Transcript_11152/g.26187  ORF Transcript_11152/g.26187 Transcript_11152/m.26187 type:complete len:126 (+) Transcript_11152:493-870(+)